MHTPEHGTGNDSKVHRAGLADAAVIMASSAHVSQQLLVALNTYDRGQLFWLCDNPEIKEFQVSGAERSIWRLGSRACQLDGPR